MLCARHCSVRDQPDADGAFAPDRIVGQQLVVVVHTGGDDVEHLERVLLPTVGQVGGDAAGTHVVVVHAQPGDGLEQAQHLFAFAPAVQHHRDRADVHPVRRLEQQVRAHAVELRHHHADPLRARRHLDVEQPFRCEAVHELVGDRRGVVHARDVGRTLDVRELLAGLLHTGVQVADHRFDLQDLFAVELHHEPQHAVGRRVLRTHVDDHRVAEIVLRPHASARDDDLSCARPVQLLGTLVGAPFEPFLFVDLHVRVVRVRWCRGCHVVLRIISVAGRP